MHVAVIGAGAAGLVCARELTRKGHHVHVYEGGRDVGGCGIIPATLKTICLEKSHLAAFTPLFINRYGPICPVNSWRLEIIRSPLKVVVGMIGLVIRTIRRCWRI